MAETPEVADGGPWHSYKCPVCGHSDEVELPAGLTRRIECSHCEADLEVTALSEFVQRAVTRVVGGGTKSG